MLHELGHALGLWGHSTSPYDVMSATYVTSLKRAQTERNGLQEGDLKLVQGIYAQAKEAEQKDSSQKIALLPSERLALAKAEAEANPNTLSLWKYARTLRDTEELQAASLQYQNALAYGGINVPLYLEFIQCLERQGKNADALSALSERLPKGYVENGRLQLEKAYVLLKLNRPSEASVLYKHALRLDARLSNSPVAQELSQLLGNDK